MDSLTQIVLGAAVGEAVLGKKVGNRAMLWGAIGGTIPDLDIFFRSFASDFVGAQEMHRGFSHSILFSFLFAPILGWLIHWIHKKREHVTRRDWIKLAFWALLTHPILDCFTNYGTQFFWPHPVRISFQNIFVADPLYTVPFLICCIVVLWNRRNIERRRKWNRLGLIISSSYLALTLVLKFFAHNRFEDQLIAQDVKFTSISTNPTAFNSILWAGIADTDSAYYFGLTSFLDSQDSIPFGVLPKNHHLLGDMANDDQVQRLIRLTRGWYAVEPRDQGVYFFDLRFGLFSREQSLRELPFGYIIYKEGDEVIITNKERVEFDMGGALNKLFVRMAGN